MRLIRINMSPEEKAKTREKETHKRNGLRRAMLPEEKAKTREKDSDRPCHTKKQPRRGTRKQME
jgi:hypothetical protein